MNTKVGGLLNLDTDLQLTFQAAADINPDDNRTPSPLFIRMYELKSTNMFNKANFIDIFERDAEVLGADMVNKQRLKHVRPGEIRETSFVLSEETKYVGLYAEFLRYKDAKYKLIIPVAQTNVVSSSAKIKITSNRLVKSE
jgi:type VI secretion system protein VasD